jgi:glycosyltransferase involved in cell wall biosynthesis
MDAGVTSERRSVDVSVVIATFNRAGIVAESVESVLSQTVRSREVVVVDDGSADETSTVLDPFVRSGAIQYVRFPENRGQAAAFNEGIRLSSGRYVAINSSDDLWLPNKLEVQVAQMEAAPEAGIAYGNLLNWDPDSGRMWVRSRKPLPSGDIYDDLAFRRTFMSWITVMVRRDCLDEVGVFDETLRRHEDRDLSLRLARRFPVVATQAPLAIVRLHGDSHPKDAADTFPYREWIRFEQRVVDKVVAANPDRDLWTRRLRARYAYVWGRGWIERGARADALRELGRSLALWPFSPKPWAYLPSALLASRSKELPGG